MTMELIFYILQTVSSESNVCLWSSGSSDYYTTGLYMYQGTYNDKAYYEKNAGQGCIIFYLFWTNLDEWVISDVLGSNISDATCYQDDIINCRVNLWSTDNDNNDLYIISNSCPLWNCDIQISIPGLTYGCDGPFTQSLGDNVWTDTKKYFYFHPYYFKWFCRTSYSKTCDISSSHLKGTFASSTRGWIYSSDANDVQLTIKPPYCCTDTFVVYCSKSNPTNNPTMIYTTIPTTKPINYYNYYPTLPPSTSHESTSHESTSHILGILISISVIILIVCLCCCVLLWCQCRKIEYLQTKIIEMPPMQPKQLNLSSKSSINLYYDDGAKHDELYELNGDRIERDVVDTNNNEKRIPDNNSYLRWTSDDIVEWLVTLNGIDEQFNKYKLVFKAALDQEGIVGSDLVNLDKNDLHRLGITSFKLKNEILQQIQILVNIDIKQHQMINAVEGDDNTYI